MCRVLRPRGSVEKSGKFLRCVVAPILLVAVAVAGKRSIDIEVDTQFGTVGGVLSRTVRGRLVGNFLGIPYAEPPIGNLRFHSPRAWNRTWDDIYVATEDGPMCVQQDLKGNILGHEDCLYLNIFVPLIAEKPDALTKMPVMIYVHGGAFNTGSSDSKKFAPRYLMDQNLTLVTLNYRLNVFGFFSTANKVAPGNYGVKDILTAVRWVHENIDSFGGDPNSVTLWGQSAGAAAVHLLALTNKTDGLFHKYILHSGSALAPWAVHPAKIIRKASMEMANLLGCRPGRINAVEPVEIITHQEEAHRKGAWTDSTEVLFEQEIDDTVGHEDYTEQDDEAIASCMRSIDVKRILRINEYYHMWRMNPCCVFGPTIEEDSEEAVVTVHPLTAIKHRLFRDIPWIVGVVENEGLVKSLGFFTELGAEDELIDNFEEYLPYLIEYQEVVENTTAFADAIEEFYFNGNISSGIQENITELIGDGLITWPTFRAINYQSQFMNSSSYFFLFSYAGTFSHTLSAGSSWRHAVTHSDDLNYFFPLLNYIFRDQLLHNTEDDTSVINVMTEMWSNFAATGVPKTWMIPAWPDYRETKEFLRFGDAKSPDVVIESDFLPDRMAFWENLTATLIVEAVELDLIMGNPLPDDDSDFAIANHAQLSLISILVVVLANFL